MYSKSLTVDDFFRVDSINQELFLKQYCTTMWIGVKVSVISWSTVRLKGRLEGGGGGKG